MYRDAEQCFGFFPYALARDDFPGSALDTELKSLLLTKLTELAISQAEIATDWRR